MKIILLGIISLFASSIFAAEPMFYTQCERQNQPWSYTSNMSVNGVTQDITTTFGNMDAYDMLLDVTRFLGDKLGETDFTAPCNLIYRAADGVETTVYQCSGRPDNDACAALSDGGMTFDGQEFMFTVFRGQLINTTIKLSQLDMHADADNPYFNARPDNYGWIEIPNKRLLANGSHVFKYNIATQALTEMQPFVEGVWNLNPVPVTEDRFWYLSNKHRSFAALVFNNPGTVRSTAARSADIADGKNDRADNTSPLMRDMHGTLLIHPGTMEGWIAYTKHLIIAGYPFRHDNGLAGSDGTLDNYAAGWMAGPYFEDDFPVLGQHMQNGAPPSFVGISLDAIRFPTQMSSWELVWSSYYRGNNMALGALFRHTVQPLGIEGPAPSMVANKQDAFLPPDLENITPFTNNNDQTSPVLPGYAGILAGKFGHPEKLPNNRLMFSYGVGGCSQIIVQDAFTYLGIPWPLQLSSDAGYWGRLSNYYTHLSNAAGVQVPACKVGIYTANTLPINSPTELIEIVNRDEWYEIMPKTALPLNAIYGIDKPVERQRPDLLVNNPALEKATPMHLTGGTISPRETEPCYGFDVQHLHNFHGCGTDTIEYTDADVAGVVVFGANPNPEFVTQSQIANTWGVGINILGYVPVESDGSFGFYAPANMPITFGLVDDHGRLLNIDMNFDPGYPGEEKTCLGCHFHSDNLPGTWQTTIAGQNKSTLTKLGMFSTQRFSGRDQNGGLIIDTVQSRNIKLDYSDVQTVFDQFCIACHGATNPAGGLDLSTPPTGNPFYGDSTWKTLSSNNYDDGAIYQRPQLSKYIKAFNPLGSLLYWKAANQRMDKRTDTQSTIDVDFGADHPTAITPDGLRIISEWIMLGAPAGNIEKLDGQPPTLVLHAIVSGDSVTGFKVGAIDSDSGLNVSSLNLCVLEGANCINIAPQAIDGGVVDIMLPQAIPNAEWGKEVRVWIDDNAGNRTELRHTLAYLAKFETQQPPPPQPLLLDAGQDVSIDAGLSLTQTVSVSGGTGQGMTYTVDWGGVSTDTGTLADGAAQFDISATFTDSPASHTVSVTVTDSAGNTAADTFTVTVNQVIIPPRPPCQINIIDANNVQLIECDVMP